MVATHTKALRVRAVDPSLKPPKKWWEEKTKEVKSGNPSYSSDQVDKTVGAIWSDLSDSKKSEIRSREGKTYGPAKESHLVRAIDVLQTTKVAIGDFTQGALKNNAKDEEALIYGVDEKNNIVYYKEYPGGRFEDNVVQYLYKLAIIKQKGDSLGDMNFGMYYKLTFDPPLRVAENENSIMSEPAFILHESTNSQISYEWYSSEEAAERAWEEIERRYETFLAKKAI